MDYRVLAFTFAISVIAGILFGLAPALKVARADLQSTLKEGGPHHRRESSGCRACSSFSRWRWASCCWRAPD